MRVATSFEFNPDLLAPEFMYVVNAAASPLLPAVAGIIEDPAIMPPMPI